MMAPADADLFEVVSVFSSPQLLLVRHIYLHVLSVCPSQFHGAITRGRLVGAATITASVRFSPPLSSLLFLGASSSRFLSPLARGR
jgi:hypothetical protein